MRFVLQHHLYYVFGRLFLLSNKLTPHERPDVLISLIPNRTHEHVSSEGSVFCESIDVRLSHHLLSPASADANNDTSRQTQIELQLFQRSSDPLSDCI